MAYGRKTGGRTAGTPNRATAEVRALAQQYGAEAVAVLVNLMRNSPDDRTRLVAAKELLDRAYGRPGPAPADVPHQPMNLSIQWARELPASVDDFV